MKFVFSFILSCSCLVLFSQSDTIKSKNLNTGVIFGVNRSNPFSGKSYSGFFAGFSVEYKLISRVSLYAPVSASFLSYEKKLPGNTSESVKVEHLLFELPLFISVKPFKWKTNPYMFVGPAYNIDPQTRNLYTYTSWSYNVGFGIESNWKYFISCPFIKYSYLSNFSLLYFGINIRSS